VRPTPDPTARGISGMLSHAVLLTPMRPRMLLSTHVRLIWVEEMAVAVSPVGAAGGGVSASGELLS
jgi:hypothetical protein